MFRFLRVFLPSTYTCLHEKRIRQASKDGDNFRCVKCETRLENNNGPRL